MSCDNRAHNYKGDHERTTERNEFRYELRKNYLSDVRVT